MLNRLSHFFSSKRKKSSSKRRSDSDSSVPSPPLSPSSLQSEEEEGLSTPTPSRKECDISVPPLACADPERFETLSQSSGHSTSSVVSIVTCNEDSTNITPRTLELDIASCLDSNTRKGFPESGAQEKCQQSSVGQSSTEGSTEDTTVSQTALSEAKVPLSEVTATPAAPKSPAWNASASKNTANSGDTPGSNCPPQFPPQLQKELRMETYLRGKDKDREEGDNLKSVAKDWREGLQEDMPLVLAIPVTVISEDSDSQSTTDSLSSMESLQQPGSSQDSHASSLQASGSSTRDESKPSTLQEKHTSAQVCVTRKTVNLPSKHKVTPQKVRGNQVQSLAREKPAKQESRELPSKMPKTAKLHP